MNQNKDFNVWDKVKIIGNTNKSLNKINDIGIIIMLDEEDCKVKVRGRNLERNWTLYNEIEHYKEKFNPTFNPEAHSHLIIDFEQIETIEEAAKKVYPFCYIENDKLFLERNAYIEGAKSEASRNYWFKIFQESK